MSLKKKIKTLEEVDENVRSFYKQSGDGYVLDIETSADDPNPEDLARQAREAQAIADKSKANVQKLTKELEDAKSKLDGTSKTTATQIEDLRGQLKTEREARETASKESVLSKAAGELASKVKPRFADLFEETELRKNWEVGEDGKLTHKTGIYKTPEENLAAWIKDIPEAAPTSTGGGTKEDDNPDQSAVLDNYRDEKGNLNYKALEEATEDGKNPQLLEALSEI